MQEVDRERQWKEKRRKNIQMKIRCDNYMCDHHYDDGVCHQCLKWYIFRVNSNGQCEYFAENKHKFIGYTLTTA